MQSSGQIILLNLSAQKEADSTPIDIVVADKKKEQTPLYWAAKLGYVEIAQFLIDKSANLEAEATDKSTPLNFSAFYGNANVVELLLLYGADIKHQDVSGNKPFHDAMQNKHREAATVLFNAGTNLHMKNKAGDTPYALASAQMQNWFAEIKQTHKQRLQPIEINLFFNTT